MKPWGGGTEAFPPSLGLFFNFLFPALEGTVELNADCRSLNNCCRFCFFFPRLVKSGLHAVRIRGTTTNVRYRYDRNLPLDHPPHSSQSTPYSFIYLRAQILKIGVGLFLYVDLVIVGGLVMVGSWSWVGWAMINALD